MKNESHQLLRISDIMDSHPLCVDKNFSIKKVAELMNDNESEVAIVVEKENPIGIITEKDLFTKVVAKGKRPENLKAKDIMSSPIITISPNDDILFAIRKMLQNKIRRLVVTEKGKVRGIVTVSDIIRVTPSLLDLISEKTSIEQSAEIELKEYTGYCDKCGEWGEDLILVNDVYLCETCRENL